MNKPCRSTLMILEWNKQKTLSDEPNLKSHFYITKHLDDFGITLIRETLTSLKTKALSDEPDEKSKLKRLNDKTMQTNFNGFGMKLIRET